MKGVAAAAFRRSIRYDITYDMDGDTSALHTTIVTLQLLLHPSPRFKLEAKLKI